MSRGAYLSLPALSAYSGLSRKLLRRLIREEGLPAYKVSRLVLVLKTEFDAWIKNCQIRRPSSDALRREIELDIKRCKR
jgi:excisionase family DNA binding protein